MSQGLREIHFVQEILNVSLIWIISEIFEERPHSYIHKFRNDALSQGKKLVYIIHLFVREVKQNFEGTLFSGFCKPRVF